VHAAHRRAKDEAKMIDVQPILDKQVLRTHHVVVIVAGKLHVQAVRGFARFAVADLVGKDEVVALHIERLSGAKQHICERWYQKRPFWLWTPTFGQSCRAGGDLQQ
jgi:hypothetical protein